VCAQKIRNFVCVQKLLKAGFAAWVAKGILEPLGADRAENHLGIAVVAAGVLQFMAVGGVAR
jgi:hypothetical protein